MFVLPPSLLKSEWAKAPIHTEVTTDALTRRITQINHSAPYLRTRALVTPNIITHASTLADKDIEKAMAWTIDDFKTEVENHRLQMETNYYYLALKPDFKSPLFADLELDANKRITRLQVMAHYYYCNMLYDDLLIGTLTSLRHQGILTETNIITDPQVVEIIEANLIPIYQINWDRYAQELFYRNLGSSICAAYRKSFATPNESFMLYDNQFVNKKQYLRRLYDIFYGFYHNSENDITTHTHKNPQYNEKYNDYGNITNYRERNVTVFKHKTLEQLKSEQKDDNTAYWTMFDMPIINPLERNIFSHINYDFDIIFHDANIDWHENTKDEDINNNMTNYNHEDDK